MITNYEIRVIRSWLGVTKGQVLKVDEKRAHHLVRGGFAELVEKAATRKKKVTNAD